MLKNIDGLNLNEEIRILKNKIDLLSENPDIEELMEICEDLDLLIIEYSKQHV